MKRAEVSENVDGELHRLLALELFQSAHNLSCIQLCGKKRKPASNFKLKSFFRNRRKREHFIFLSIALSSTQLSNNLFGKKKKPN